MQRVTFKNKFGITLVGNVYYPQSFNEQNNYPALVMSAPAGGIKEQASGLYAKKMAAKGYVTIAMDNSFQGESGGEPRYQENPYTRVEDIRAAIDYLVTQSFVDEKRIGVLGICAGGGYAAAAAMTERRIKAVALVVPVNGGREMRADGQAASIEALESVATQRTAEARHEAPLIIPWMPDDYKTSDDIDSREGYDYYRTSRGYHQSWDNKMRFTVMDTVMSFDAFHLADQLLTQPLKIIVGSKVGSFGSKQDGEEVYQKAATEDKDLIIVDGASHFDFYDRRSDYAVEEFGQFFSTRL